MEKENNQDLDLTQEQEERILYNLEKGAPEVAQEIYPDDIERQKEFVKGAYKVAAIMCGFETHGIDEKVENKFSEKAANEDN